MLTQEQINKIRQDSGLSVNNNSGNYVGKYDHLLNKEPKREGFFKETIGDIKQTGSALKETYNKTSDKLKNIFNAENRGEQGSVRTSLQGAGALAGGISSGIGDVLMGAIKTALPQADEDAIKKTVTSVIEKSAPVAVKIDQALGRPVGSTVDAYNNLDDKSKRDIDAIFGGSMLAFDIATLGFGKKVGEKVVKEGIEVGTDIAKKTLNVADDVLSKGKLLASKAKTEVPQLTTPLKAIGEILQGKTKDINAGLKSIASLDTAGVKTYKDLQKVITSKIKELSGKVDKDLGIDKTFKKLKELNVVTKTAEGTKVISKPIERAFGQLQELYTKIGDDLGLANIKDVIKNAKTKGLTNIDINNLARQYGSEFGSKAFSKIGEPLTSVNAKLFENTRKALKDLSRSGLKGDVAKQADELMSNLYKTKDLVSKNVESVAKLTQKIRERGLFEKAGHFISKYADILTGGTIRGIVGGILPRGAGYKTLNAIDLEGMLKKNLEIIQEAIKSNSDNEIINILKKLEVKTPPKPTTLLKTKGENLSTKLVSKTNTLEVEATKYKTADEFVDKNIDDYVKSTKEYKEWSKGSNKIIEAYHGTPYSFDKFEIGKKQAGAYELEGISFATKKSNAEPFSRQYTDKYYKKIESLNNEYKEKLSKLEYKPTKIEENNLHKELNLPTDKNIPNREQANSLLEFDYNRMMSMNEDARKTFDNILSGNKKEIQKLDNWLKKQEKFIELEEPKGNVYKAYIKGKKIQEEIGEEIGFGSTRNDIVGELDGDILRIKDADTGQYIGEEIIVNDPSQIFIVNAIKTKSQLTDIWNKANKIK